MFCKYSLNAWAFFAFAPEFEHSKSFIFVNLLSINGSGFIYLSSFGWFASDPSYFDKFAFGFFFALNAARHAFFASSSEHPFCFAYAAISFSNWDFSSSVNVL